MERLGERLGVGTLLDMEASFSISPFLLFQANFILFIYNLFV